jgi:hypothetical protein
MNCTAQAKRFIILFAFTLTGCSDDFGTDKLRENSDGVFYITTCIEDSTFIATKITPSGYWVVGGKLRDGCDHLAIDESTKE